MWDREAPTFERGLRELGYEIGSHYVADLLIHLVDVRAALDLPIEPGRDRWCGSRSTSTSRPWTTTSPTRTWARLAVGDRTRDAGRGTRRRRRERHGGAVRDPAGLRGATHRRRHRGLRVVGRRRRVHRVGSAGTRRPRRTSASDRSVSIGTGPSALGSDVALEDRRLGEAGETVLDRAGAGLADALDLDEVGHAGPQDLLQVREPLDDVVGDELGQAGDLVQQPVARGAARAESRPASRGRWSTSATSRGRAASSVSSSASALSAVVSSSAGIGAK